MVNNQMVGAQQVRHHITEAQAIYLQEAFRDIKMLLDMAAMEDDPLTDLLRFDGKLNPVQIFSMRRLWRTILRQEG